MNQLLCPKCGYPQHCDCNDFCKSRIPIGEKPKIWCRDGEGWTCAGCGLTLGVDEWLDVESKIVRGLKSEMEEEDENCI
jgi:hypothetical protein